MSASDLKHDLGEMWLARRLGDFGHVFSGVTDTATRKARMREAIIERGIAEAICGKRAGRVETFSATFQRIYGEAL